MAVLASFSVAIQQDRFRPWIIYSVALALGCSAHLLTIWTIVGLGVFVGCQTVVDSGQWSRKEALARWWPFWTSTLAGASIGFSWVLWQPQDAQSLVLDGSLPPVMEYFASAVISLGPTMTSWTGLSTPGEVQIVGFSVAALAAYGGLAGIRQRRFAAMLLPVTLVPIIALYFTLGPKWGWIWSRYLLGALGPFLVLVAAGTERLSRGSGRLASVGASVVVLGLLAPFSYKFLSGLPRTARGYDLMDALRSLDRNRSAIGGEIYMDPSSIYASHHLIHGGGSMPRYWFEDRVLHRVEERTGVGGVGSFPTAGPVVAVSELESGDYALIARDAAQDECSPFAASDRVVHRVQLLTDNEVTVEICRLGAPGLRTSKNGTNEVLR
jgi:hypothetical protein